MMESITLLSLSGRELCHPLILRARIGNTYCESVQTVPRAATGEWVLALTASVA